MKFWEKLKESELGEKAAKKHPWWVYIFFFFGLIIGATAVALVVGVVYLVLGFFFHCYGILLWHLFLVYQNLRHIQQQLLSFYSP